MLKNVTHTILLLFFLAVDCFCQIQLPENQNKTGSEFSLDSIGPISDKERSFDSVSGSDSISYINKLKDYLPSLMNNFASQVEAPFHFGKKEWMITGVSAGITWALIENDNKIDEFARVQKQKYKLIARMSPALTRLGGDIGLYTLAGAGLVCTATKDLKGLETCLLASQAVITSGVWVRLVKLLTGRERPFDSYDSVNPGTGQWHGPFAMVDQDRSSRLGGSYFDSFPSGHTATAFSIATVVATQYKDIKSIPIISYSIASLVGLSRLTEHEHWASDVLVGALIGYACGRQVTSASEKHHNNAVSPSFTKSGNKAKIFLSGNSREISLSVRF